MGKLQHWGRKNTNGMKTLCQINCNGQIVVRKNEGKTLGFIKPSSQTTRNKIRELMYGLPKKYKRIAQLYDKSLYQVITISATL